MATEGEELEAFFRSELLFAHLLDVLSEAREDGDDGDRRGLKAADLLLTLAQAERLVRTPADVVARQLEHQATRMDDGASEATAPLLGLTPQSLRRAHGLDSADALRAHEAVARQSVLPRLEQHLREQCVDVHELAMPSLMASARRPDPRGVLQAASVSQIAELPALLVELEVRKKRLARENPAVEQHLRAQLIQDVELSKKMAALLTSMIVDHQRNDQPRVIRAKVQWLAACSRALRAKAQVLVDQLAVEMYPAEDIQLLGATHDALQERKRKALEEREQLRAKLDMYRSGDAQYQEVARQYGVVLRGIEEKTNWLNSLNM